MDPELENQIPPETAAEQLASNSIESQDSTNELLENVVEATDTSNELLENVVESQEGTKEAVAQTAEAIRDLKPAIDAAGFLANFMQAIKGDQGEKGDTGEKGDDGYSPQKGIDYFTDEEIEELKDQIKILATPKVGEDYLTDQEIKEIADNVLSRVEIPAPIKGEDGEDGITPVKGVDYFTPGEVKSIVKEVISLMPKSKAPKEFSTKDLLEKLKGQIDYSDIKNTPTVFKGQMAGTGYLREITDVQLSNPTNGQALVYNAATNTWRNGTVSGGGGTVGPGTINEIAYFDTTTSIASLSVATYPSLAELAYVKGVTSAIQTQINAKAPSTSPTFATSITGSYLTASELLITDGSKNIVSAPVATYPSLTELTYLKGVTSAVQTQINAKANSSGALTQFIGNTAWRVFYSDGSGDIIELALGADGTFLKSNGAAVAPSFATPAGSGDVTKVGTPVNNQVGVWTGDGTLEGDAALTFDTTTDVLSSGGLLLSGLTASELVITDGSKNLVSAAVATYPSLTELTYLKGVTSAIQTQLNAKAPTTSPTFSTSITGSYLTASEMLITDGSKNIVSAPVATYPSLTELTYLKGVTSAIQTQLNNKQGLDTQLTDLAGLSYTGNSLKVVRVNAGETGFELATLSGSGATTALDNLASVAINTALVLATSDAFALGSATKQWSDLFLAEGGVINWDNGDVTLTQTGDALNVLGGNLTIGSPTLVTTAGLNVKAVTGNTYNIFLEGTGGVIIPTIAFKHSSDTNGVVFTGDDTGFGFANIGEGQTLFMKPGYPDAYWKTHGSSPAKFHFQSHNGSAYVDSMVINAGLTSFGHASPTAYADLLGGTTAAASLRIRDGVAPTTPNDGDMWQTGTHLYVRIGGVSYQLDQQSGGSGATTALDNLASVAINAALVLGTSDAFALGSATKMWSDLFLASGAVINFDNGNAALTHSSGILTVGTGDLRVTTAGTNTASVVTVGGTQTLTSKTLTSPAITTATLSGTQLLSEGASIGLDPSASADGTYSGITVTATAGYTQAFGDLVYLDPTDSRWEACDANATSGADGDTRGTIGMVVVAGTDGNACTILLQGIIRADANFPTFTINSPIYASETAGDVTQTQPVTTDAVIRVVGFAITADSMYFNPSSDYSTHI